MAISVSSSEKCTICHENGASLPYNSRMSYLEIILPFGIPPASLAKQLLQQSQVPSLQKLLSHAKQPQVIQFNEFARLLPHEYWLYTRDSSQHQAPPPDLEQRYNSPALAHQLMEEFGLSPSSNAEESSFWFVLQPVHIHIARDHLVLTDTSRLQIDPEHAQQLFDVARENCQEYGFTLLFGNAQTWFLRADAWKDLKTASIQAAAGHNMDIWMAEGDMARAWRKLQNEIQMAWHDCAVNQAREAQALVAINSVWIHGGSAQNAHIAFERGGKALTSFLQAKIEPVEKKIIVIDELLEPALNNDWGSWLANFNELEEHCFAPLQEALQRQQFKSIDLAVSDAHQLAVFNCKKPSWWQSFSKPSLSRLQNIAETKSE